MLINWFTVVAQAVNFLILVWLLKRFLYKPILHAIDEREKGIATLLADAEAKKAEAHRERDDFLHKNEAFDQERAALLKKATDEANAERQRLVDEAKKDADALRAKRQEALRIEQRNLGQDILRMTQKQVFAIVRKTLTDLAGADLEERMGDVFVRRVRELTGEAKEQLATAFKSSNHQVSVHSTFDLPPLQKMRDRERGEGNLRPGSQGPVRDRAGAGLRHRSLHQWTQGILEHRGLPGDAGKERRRTSARGGQAPAEGRGQARRPRPGPKAEAKNGPKREPKNGPATVVAATKADH